MQPAVLIRLRPAGPWRYGPGDGGDDRVDTQYRSDRLFSALTLAIKQLGWLEEWLEATAKSSKPAVAFTSLFPFQGTTLFVKPPATLWPPPASLLTTSSPVFLSKIRWNVAQFIPASLLEAILLGQGVLADQWMPDAESSCLLRRDRLNTIPFRTVLRSGVAVDRVSGSTANVHTSACVEFEPGAGLWTVARFRDEGARSDWGQRIAAALGLLADVGFGGKRSSGWGQTQAPEFEEGTWPGLLLPKLGRVLARGGDSESAVSSPPLYWLLSLFAPADSDKVDWAGGEYRLVTRGGFVDGGSGSKKQVRMIAEGSVLASEEELVGTTVDVAPEESPHPVYRSGIAVSLRLPAFAAPESVENELDQILSELEVAAAEESAAEKDPAGSGEGALGDAVPEESPIEQLPVGNSIITPESSVDASLEVREGGSGSPELLPGMETHRDVSPEVEPQGSSERLASIDESGDSGQDGEGVEDEGTDSEI